MSASRTLKRVSLLVWMLLCISSLLLVAAKPSGVFPEVIPLPNGFQPEGFTIGKGTTFFAGSLATGAVYRGDLATGKGAVLVPPQTGRQSTGLKLDKRTNLLYVAGGPTGSAYVYNATTGSNVAAIQLTGEPTTFINDEVVTERAVYFTDSFRPVLYRVPLGHDGQLPNPPTSQEIPLSGDFVFTGGGAFNINGIAATEDGKTLIVVSDTQSAILKVNPKTGAATLINLGGNPLPNGDGLVLDEHTLYVVQNFLNEVAVIRLNSSSTSGKIVRTITSPFLRIPTTAARFGDALYVVNARFDTPPTPDTQYEIVRLSK